jgi:NAD(P)-dependent dehydrogenase (short-subunit alcohol dehydrogenase family)
MNVNFWGMVYGIKAFLPALRRMENATIVNLSSVFGLFGAPGQAAYSASKFAIRGFSESLRAELRDAGVHVVTVHPGGIKTNIARNARIAEAADRELQIARGRTFEEVALMLPARHAPQAIVHGLRLRQDRVLIGDDALQIDLITRALGPAGSRLLSDMFLRGAAEADTAVKPG